VQKLSVFSCLVQWCFRSWVEFSRLLPLSIPSSNCRDNKYRRFPPKPDVDCLLSSESKLFRAILCVLFRPFSWPSYSSLFLSFHRVPWQTSSLSYSLAARSWVRTLPSDENSGDCSSFLLSLSAPLQQSRSATIYLPFDISPYSLSSLSHLWELPSQALPFSLWKWVFASISTPWFSRNDWRTENKEFWIITHIRQSCKFCEDPLLFPFGTHQPEGHLDHKTRILVEDAQKSWPLCLLSACPKKPHCSKVIYWYFSV